MASAALLVVAWLALIGCGKKSLGSDAGALCGSDADCTAAQRCEPLKSPLERPTVVAPCMVTFAYCSTSTDCSEGQVCWPVGRNASGLPPNCFPTGSTCGPPCSALPAACYSDEVCEANGECRLPACDEASGMACPDYWRCDPAAAETETVQPVFGANEMDSANYSRDAARGCARIRCDESGGFTCKDGWVCEPEGATDPSGCVALPCAEAGHCSDDTRYICEPTSSASRPAGSDAHGCVLRNCEEGFACQRLVNGINVAYCDFAGLQVDAYGCASHRCDEPGGACGASQACEPGARFADTLGCRPITCEEGLSCGSLTCDPSSPNADTRGCVAPAGVGGSSGNGGSASGHAGTGAAGQGAQGGSSNGGSSNGGSSNGGNAGTGGAASGGSSGTAGSAASAGMSSHEMMGRCVDR
jgi:hypothetical protein